MKNIIRFSIVPILIIACFTGYLFAGNIINQIGNDSSFEKVYQHMDGQGRLIDIQDEIKMHGIDDIKYFDTGKFIELEYGVLKWKWTREKFFTEDNYAKLEKMHIKVEVSKDKKKYKMYWEGKELSRWVR